MSPDIFATLAATWPAERVWRVGGWTCRAGAGGGSRVSAATWDAPGEPPDVPRLAAACAEAGTHALVMVRGGEHALDAALAKAGYRVRDETLALSAPIADLADPLAARRTYAAWPPLAAQAEIWAAGGIGPARLAVMDRATAPKTALLGRVGDRPAGTAFVAVAGTSAMLHALEVAAPHRRQGLGRTLTRQAAAWAATHGATDLSLLVTRRNSPAFSLYTSLNFRPVGHYHYREMPEA